MKLWPFDPDKPHAEHPLDQMPRRVRRDPRFNKQVAFYKSRAGGEMTSHGAETLAGAEVYEMLLEGDHGDV